MTVVPIKTNASRCLPFEIFCAHVYKPIDLRKNYGPLYSQFKAYCLMNDVAFYIMITTPVGEDRATGSRRIEPRKIQLPVLAPEGQKRDVAVALGEKIAHLLVGS